MSSEETPTTEGLSSLLSPLRTSGKYSDMKILCGSRVFDAHINIVCSQSKVFAAMMDGGWKEANERQVSLPEDDPHAVGKMLDYLYTHQYDAEETGASLILHARIYVCGDRYDIPGRKSLSKQKYLEVLKTHYQHAGFGRSLGIIYYELPGSDTDLRDAAIEFAAEHLVDIYSEKNNTLRNSLDGSGNGHILSDVVEIMAKKEVKCRELYLRADGFSLRHNLWTR